MGAQVTLPQSEDPPHASSNDEDEWPNTDFFPPEVCGIRRARLRRRPTSTDKPPQGLRISGSVKPLHLGDGSHRSSEENVYDEAFLYPNSQNSPQTQRQTARGTSPGTDHEQLRCSTPDQHRAMCLPCPTQVPQYNTRSNETVLGRYPSDAERSSSIGSEVCLSTEVASTTVISAFKSFDRDHGEQTQAPQGECRIPLYSKSGPLTLTPRGGVIQRFPARAWLGSPNNQEINQSKSAYARAMQKQQLMRRAPEVRESAAIALPRTPKYRGTGSKRKSRNKMKTRHRRTFQRQNSAQKEVVLGLEPVLKDRNTSNSEWHQASKTLKHQVSNPNFQSKIRALSRQSSFPSHKSKPRNEKGPFGQLSSRGRISNCGSKAEAFKNRCTGPISDSLVGGFCSDSCIEHKEKTKSRKALQSKVQTGHRLGSMSHRGTNREEENGSNDRSRSMK